MKRIIKSIENQYLIPSLDFVQDVFTKSDSKEEGQFVRRLVEEIRAKKYYIPDLELIMTDSKKSVAPAILSCYY